VALPTWSLQSGTRVETFDLMLFNPGELTRKDDARWAYAGSVFTGQDNSAECNEDEGGKLPCVKSSGALSFEEVPGAVFPLIRIARSGTDMESGKVRTLGNADTLEYRYEATQKIYR
jgi:hypothetical protein